ncbi:MAG: ABC transporter permease [Vicinamibacterales bacterium]
MLADIKYALRSMTRKPLLYGVAILTLALGIGANAAIFSVVYAVLLRPLPYPDPDQLMMVWTYNPRQGFDKDVGTYPNFDDWRRASQSFERISGVGGASMTLTGAGDPAQIRGSRVTPEFFETLAVRPAMGRVFDAANAKAGGERVAVLAHRFWQQRFGGDRSILGRGILLDGISHEVVGVMPEAFAYPEDAEFWVPLAPVGPFEQLFTARGAYWLTVIGRLKPGVARPAAQSEMDGIAARLETQYPSNAGIGVRLVPMHEEIVGDVRRPLLILLGAVCLVLLIACANVANLLLTRAAARQRELAIRAALGAGHARLLRLLLTESLLLGLIGGGAGILLAAWGVDLLQTLAPPGLPRLTNVRIHWQVIAYTAGASLLTGIVFGLGPALQGARRDSGANLKEGGRSGTESLRARRVRALLAISELAIALVLLTGAGLLIRSVIALNRADPGFATRGVLALRIDLPRARYHDDHRIVGFWDQLTARLAALPGVEAAGVGTSVLLSRLPNSATIAIEGTPARTSDAPNVPVPMDTVTPGYFSALRIPLTRGRMLTDADSAQTQPVVLVNESFVRRFFPDRDPIGRRVTFGDPAQKATPWQTIVGVVADTRRGGFDREPWAETYFPLRQSPNNRMFVFLRTNGDPTALAGAAQAAVWSLDRNQAVASVRTVVQLLERAEANRRFTTLLLGVFAAVALTLAAVGVYGVLAYSTAQRTQEIGIRMALGADRRSVLRMVLAGGARIAASGIAIGLVGALLLTRVLSGLLFGVSERDPLTFVLVATTLMAVALAACWIPARRAVRVEPVMALRGE